MKKILLLSLILLPFGLQAMPGLAMPQQEEVNTDDILIMAYDVRRDLMYQPELSQDLVTEIEAIIRDTLQQEDPKILKAYKFILRRYDKVAHICKRAKFDQMAYLKARKELIERKQLVTEMISIYTRLNTAQNVVTNLDTILPNKPTEAQRNEYYEQFKKMYDEQFVRIEEIQKKIADSEKVLLGDPRTFWEKYGGLITGTGIVIGGLTVCATAGNLFGQWLRNRKDASQPGSTGTA